MERRQFIAGAALAALLPAMGMGRAVLAAAGTPAVGGKLLPVALNPGDTVALVSPTSAVADSLDLQLAQEVLEALGLRVRPGKHYGGRYGHLAGVDAGRAEDINAAFAD